MAICTQNSLIYRFMHWLMCLLMISVQPDRKFLWNAPVFPEIWRTGCNMVWDGSSRTVGRLPTCYDVWSSQGLINAVVPFSCVPAGEHFCLGILVPLSLCLVCIPKINSLVMRPEATTHFPMMPRRSNVSGESKQSWDLGWAPENRQVAIGWNPLPFHEDGKMSLQHPLQPCDHTHYATTTVAAACVSWEGWLRSVVAQTPPVPACPVGTGRWPHRLGCG